jgi:hypothetical protein
MKRFLVVFFVALSGLASYKIAENCGFDARCWADDPWLMAVGGPPATGSLVRTGVRSDWAKSLYKNGLKVKGGTVTIRGAVIHYLGYEITNTKLWFNAAKSHPVQALREMVRTGAAGRYEGKPIHLHHHLRRGEGPLVMLPSDLHKWADNELHPKGFGSTINRPRFRGERESLWKALACEELKRRGLSC